MERRSYYLNPCSRSLEIQGIGEQVVDSAQITASMKVMRLKAEGRVAICRLPCPCESVFVSIFCCRRVLKDRVAPSLHFSYIPCRSTISHFVPVLFDLQVLIKEFLDSITMENKPEPEKDHIGDNGFDTGNTTTPTNESVNGKGIDEKDYAALGSNQLENGLWRTHPAA
jgi:hypothetical protein